MSLRQYYTMSYASEQELKPLLHNSRIESGLFLWKGQRMNLSKYNMEHFHSKIPIGSRQH